MSLNYKIVVVGSSAVGKSAIVERLVHGTFTENTTSTCGADYYSYVTNSNDKEIKLQIWDTAGQERYKSISKSYFRNAVGALLVYDITNVDSFNQLADWLNDLLSLCAPNAYIILIGNKSDLENYRRVGSGQANDFAQRNQLVYIETSASTGDNIKEAFERLAAELSSRDQQGALSVNTGPRQLVAEPAPSSGWCC